MVRESIFDETEKAILEGIFALIRPVMTSTDGSRREHQVNACRPRLLSDPRDQLFNLLAHDHHHVRIRR